MSSGKERIAVTYMVQARIEGWVEHDNGRIVAASPTLRTTIGHDLSEVRRGRMVVKMRVLSNGDTGAVR